MRIDGIQLREGSNISNLTVASGTSFPSSPNDAELFYRTDSSTTVRGLYAYIAGSWDRISSTDAVTAPNGASLPGTGNAGDLFYLTSGTVGLYVYTGSAWVVAAGASFTITGDVTGSISGTSGVLTLATVNASPVSASFSKVTTNGKGLVTSTTAVVAADITALVDATYVNVTGDTMTGNLAVNSAAGSPLISSAAVSGQSASLELAGNGNTVGSGGFLLRQSTDSRAFVINRASADIVFGAATTTALTLTAAGQALFSTGAGAGSATALLSVRAGSTYTPNLQINGATTATASGHVSRFSADNVPPVLSLAKSRAATVGTQTVMTAGDGFGDIDFSGSDGTQMQNGARISAVSDGTSGSVSMPGRLVFLTTATGSGTPTERMRIDSVGNVGMGMSPAGSNVKLSLSDGTITTLVGYNYSSNTISGIGTNNNFALGFLTNGAERMRIDTGGAVYINTTVQLNSGFTSKLSVSGTITAGTTSTAGSIILQGNYGTGALSNWGTEASSGGPVTSYGAYPSSSAASFLSSTGVPLTRSALIVADTIRFYTGASQTVTIGSAVSMTEVMRIDNAGNVGVGVAPSSWGSRAAIESAGYALWGATTGNFLLGNNVYQNAGATYIYKNTAAASLYYQNAGTHAWYVVPSGSSGGTITLGTAALSLDNTGVLLLGTTSNPGVSVAVLSHVGSNAAAITVGDIATPANDTGIVLRSTGTAWIQAAASGGDIAFKTSGTERMRLTGAGNLTMSNGNFAVSGSTNTIGYSTGSGGAVTQATSRTTGVTLNKSNGAITLFSTAGSSTATTFTVTNSTVAATDTIIVNCKSSSNAYLTFVTAVAAGSFNITFQTTGGTGTDAPVFNFAVIKAVAA